jgi:hypothetical protein
VSRNGVPKKEGSKAKVDTVDIFRIQSDGELVWLESAISVQDGRAKVSELMMNTPGQYFLFCQKTQEKIYVGSDGSAKSSDGT